MNEIFKPCTPRIPQVITDMPFPSRCFDGCAGSEFNCRARHLLLAKVRVARQFLDDIAIAVAGAKIHLRVDTRRILAQDLFRAAGLLDETLPIRGGEQAQAENTIGNDGLVCQRRRSELARDPAHTFWRVQPGQFGSRSGEPLQKPDSQHVRQRPEFPDLQGRDLLILLHKSDGLGQVDLVLAVSNPFPCQRQKCAGIPSARCLPVSVTRRNILRGVPPRPGAGSVRQHKNCPASIRQPAKMPGPWMISPGRPRTRHVKWFPSFSGAAAGWLCVLVFCPGYGSEPTGAQVPPVVFLYLDSPVRKHGSGIACMR